ncbi:hypothetical protein T265_05638 [Opisthorchis viverrini]|uniref:Uncharacterized protein n=1 Tax=Opisthorchis viverrini TaxID=6198 RepID=A0A074ZJ05_OPIVI|nr:hypothetical protein T265_05638 [Opisthorchis viverrini]KER27313.1 hypothetical protein T265_05638 [Opisthorchis viverrini]
MEGPADRELGGAWENICNRKPPRPVCVLNGKSTCRPAPSWLGQFKAISATDSPLVVVETRIGKRSAIDQSLSYTPRNERKFREQKRTLAFLLSVCAGHNQLMSGAKLNEISTLSLAAASINIRTPCGIAY